MDAVKKQRGDFGTWAQSVSWGEKRGFVREEKQNGESREKKKGRDASFFAATKVGPIYFEKKEC